MITRGTFAELLAFTPEQYLTTTLYLQIDGDPKHAEVIELKELIKRTKKIPESKNLDQAILKSVNSDLRKIKEYVTLKFSREGVRTLVIFSCSARKFWKVLTLNLPLRSQLLVNRHLHVRPLALLLEEYNRFLVVIVERSKARIFEVHAGDIMEMSSILDEVPGKVRMGGFAGYEERRISRHIEDHVRRHFKNVADAAFDLHKKHSYDSVVLLGSEQNTHEFHHYLHNTLHDKIVAMENEDFMVTPRGVLERVSRIERELKQREDRRLLERLFNQVNSGGLGIVGLDSTLRALQQGQVNFLVVQEGYEKSGYRCEECRSLLTENRACDYCGGKTRTVNDIIEEAVQEALHQGCQVKYITTVDSPLRSTGQIGAMLRFRA